MSATLGSDRYLSYLRDHPSRHAAAEEAVADIRFRAEARVGLTGGELAAFGPSIDALMTRAPEARPAGRAVPPEDLVRDLERETGVTTTLADTGLAPSGSGVPHYLVMEPHLPAPTAMAVRAFLMALT